MPFYRKKPSCSAIRARKIESQRYERVCQKEGFVYRNGLEAIEKVHGTKGKTMLMKTPRSLTIGSLAVLTGLCFLAGNSKVQAQEEYLLRHTYKAGMSATNEISVQMQGTMRMQEGEKLPYRATAEMTMPIKVAKVEENGDTKLEIRLFELTNKQSLGEETQNLVITPAYMSVDGEVIWDRIDIPGPHPLAEFYGQRVFVVLSNRGEVKDFSSLQAFSQMMPNTDIPSQLAHGSVIFPESPVSVGGSWKAEGTAVLTPKGEKCDSVTHYTLERVETKPDQGPIAVISVVRSASAEKILIDANAPGAPPTDYEQVQAQKLRINSLKQDFKGTIHFDIEQGRVISTSQKGHHFVDTSAELAFVDQRMTQNSVADLDLEIETRMKYNDH